MFKAPVFTADGDRQDERELPEALFDGTVHQAAMWQTVKAYLANQRQATAATKTRRMVSGGNRKPWRQKGTGRARAGSTRAPHWRGGGNVFGPKVGRNFHEDVPKKVKRLARRSAFNARAEDGAVLLVDVLDFDTPKTRRIVDLLGKAGADGNVLLLTDGHKPLVHRSTRNVPGLEVRPFGEESAYDVLWADTVVIEAAALARADAEEVSDA
jgi:large subunit ribosomal protein L4